MSTHNDEIADRMIEEIARLKAEVSAEHQASNLWRERYERVSADLAAARAECEQFKNCISAREVRAMVDERNKAWSDLADARVLLKEAHGWLDPWESRQSALRDRIDAAIAGEKK